MGSVSRNGDSNLAFIVPELTSWMFFYLCFSPFLVIFRVALNGPARTPGGAHTAAREPMSCPLRNATASGWEELHAAGAPSPVKQMGIVTIRQRKTPRPQKGESARLTRVIPGRGLEWRSRGQADSTAAERGRSNAPHPRTSPGHPVPVLRPLSRSGLTPFSLCPAALSSTHRESTKASAFQGTLALAQCCAYRPVPCGAGGVSEAEGAGPDRRKVGC